MKKQTLCGFVTLLSGLLAIALTVRLNGVNGHWPHGVSTGAALGLLSAVFATQWAEYKGRTPVAPTQPGTPGWLRKLLFSSMLLLTMVGANAQTTWTRRYQTQGEILFDVAYGAGRFVTVGNNSVIQISTDGIVWTTQVAGSQADGALSGVVYANGQFVAVGSYGHVKTSPDGLTWSNQVSGTEKSLQGIAYGGGRFIAVGYDGIAITSTDGIAWTTLTTGTSVDLNDITYGSGTFTIVGDGGLIRTTPNGIIWTEKVSGTTVALEGVTAGSNGQVVAVGDNNTIVSSTNGIVWIVQVAAGSQFLSAVTYDPAQGVYVAVADGVSHHVLRSPDGINWSSWSSGISSSLYGVRYLNGRLIAVGAHGFITSSLNGTSWYPRTINYDIQLKAAAYGNGHYVAVGKYPISIQPANGTVAITSTNGINYTLGSPNHNAGPDEGFEAVVFGNGQFVAVGGSATVQTSPDGAAWVSRFSENMGFINDVAYGGGQFIAVSNGFKLDFLRSPDGITWTKGFAGVENGLPNYFQGITYANGQFMAVGYNGVIATTSNGVVWTAQSSGTTNLLRSVTYGNGTYVAVGANGTTLRSANGVTWTSVVPFTAQVINRITFGNGQFVIVGEGNQIFTSSDGTTWTARVANNVTSKGIAYGNGLFVAVGNGGSIMTSPDDGGAPPVNPGSFAITGVTLVSCNPISVTQRQLVFNPQYAGLSGQPISFHVVNELVPTPNAGPYSLNMYIDNPTITLKATQSGTAGEASFGYNWLAACTGGGIPPGNQPPVAPVIPDASGTVGQVYAQTIPLFTDPEGQPLTYSVAGLPPGLLVIGGGNIVGPPTTAGVYVITVTATDPGGLSASATYTLTIVPAGGNPGSFVITGVTLVSCQPISPTQRQLVFTPQYAGVNGQPISFQVVNEMVPTANAGPYTLGMYVDNPSITLKATQTGTANEASFVYNWSLACAVGNARTGVESTPLLQVRLLGNPVENGAVSVEVRGAGGQFLQLVLTDLRGQVVGSHQVAQADSVEEHTFEIGHQSAGLYLLRANTTTQAMTMKVLKR